MGITLTFFCSIYFIFNTTCSERLSVELVIRVLDTDQFEPVINCHLIKNREVLAVSDAYGQVIIDVEPGDTLTFSCIGFHTLTMILTENDLELERLIVFMDVKKTMLREVTVRDIPTEEELKRMALNKEVKVDENQVIAKKNIRYIQMAGIYGMPPKMGAFENYQNSLKGPQPVVFWSSGNKGLIKSIKNLSRRFEQGRFPIYQPGGENFSFDLWKVPNSPDTLKNTSVEITLDNKE